MGQAQWINVIELVVWLGMIFRPLAPGFQLFILIGGKDERLDKRSAALKNKAKATKLSRLTLTHSGSPIIFYRRCLANDS